MDHGAGDFSANLALLVEPTKLFVIIHREGKHTVLFALHLQLEVVCRLCVKIQAALAHLAEVIAGGLVVLTRDLCAGLQFCLFDRFELHIQVEDAAVCLREE